MILALNNYTNEKGMLLVEKVLMDQTNQVPFDRFTGTCMIGINDPRGGVHAQQIDFPISANTVQEAFDKFEESAKAYVEKMKREANKKIVTAGSMPQTPPHDIVKKLLRP